MTAARTSLRTTQEFFGRAERFRANADPAALKGG